MPHDMTVETHGWFARIPFLNKYGAKHILQIQDGRHVSLIVVFFGFALGILGQQLGFHPAIGAYFAGLILCESYFDLEATEDGKKATNTMEEASEAVCSSAFSWIGPIFFVRLGTSLHIEAAFLETAIPRALGITAIVSFAQFLSAALSARYVPGGYSWAESGLIGFGMLGRAELFFVVLNEAKKNDIFNGETFFTLALSALLINILLAISVSLFTPVFRKYHPESEDNKDQATEKLEADAAVVGELPPAPLESPTESRQSGQVTPVKRKSVLKVKRGVGLGRSERFDADEYLAKVRRHDFAPGHHAPYAADGEMQTQRPQKARSTLVMRTVPPAPHEEATSGPQDARDHPFAPVVRRAVSSITRRPEPVKSGS